MLAYVQFEIQETCGSYNGCSKGLKDKFVGGHRMLRKIHFSTALAHL